MYFKLKNLEADNTNNFSYMLCKHPDNVYTKDFNNYRNIIGKFIDKDTYEIIVNSDPIDFIKLARKINMSSYLYYELNSVCPYNLKGITSTLSSVIAGNNKELTDEEFFKNRFWSCTIGPLPIYNNYIEGLFKDFELTSEIDSETQHNKNTSISKMICIKNDVKCSLTEFLQKVYLITYAITNRIGKNKLYQSDENQIIRLANLSKNWITKYDAKIKIIRKLYFKENEKYNKIFESILNEDELKNIEFEDNNLVFTDDVSQENIDRKIKLNSFNKHFEKESLHTKRHKKVLEIMTGIIDSENLDKIKLIDFGSSDGKFLRKIVRNKNNYDLLNKFKKLISVDSNQNIMKRLRGKFKKFKNIILLENNAVYPNIKEMEQNPDFITCIEFIEHLNDKERESFIYNILYIFQPDNFILTTPNVEYNKKYNLPDGVYRRKDHKIEFDTEQFNTEVVEPLSQFYDIIFHNIIEDDIQPSFVISCKLKKDVELYKNNKLIRKLNSHQSEFYLPISNYNISNNEINIGYCTNNFKNIDNIFYLAPTMSPVDYTDSQPDYLEHPESAFDYFKNRLTTENQILVGQHKYMGSRGYILLFKNKEIANNMGFDKPIVINSKGGFKFYKDNEEDIIYDELKNNMGNNDFIILDCEMMPWSYKYNGRSLNEDFIQPGECNLLDNLYKGTSIENSVNYLDTLSKFTKNEDITIRVFGWLASGCVYQNPHNLNYRYRVNKNGFYIDHLTQQDYINNLVKNSKIILPCNTHIVYLDQKESIDISMERWHEYCKSGGEGFVYKPLYPTSYLESGYFVQPALKVRGDKYLQMVYGIDYKNGGIFDVIKVRNTKSKRIQAIREFELSMYILNSFLSNADIERKRYIGGFLGCESTHRYNIDATL